MNKLQYRAYLLTPAWREIAERAKARDGHRCRICNSKGPLESKPAPVNKFDKLNISLKES